MCGGIYSHSGRGFSNRRLMQCTAHTNEERCDYRIVNSRSTFPIRLAVRAMGDLESVT